jgi:putative transposase
VADRRQDVGLFRYSLAREATDAGLSKAERGALVRDLAGREHLGPDGRWVRVGRSTLDRWVRMLRGGGFEALLPVPRRGVPATAAEVLGLAETLKREKPERTAAQVRRVMAAGAADAMAVPSVRTLQRHFVRVGLNVRPDGGPPRAFGRFGASRRNELWSGDALHGPTVAGRKAILFAFIDDYSRLLPGYRWGYSEDTLRLEAALRSGLASRGVPEAILVDRGSAFVSGQLLRACATLRVRLIHARPYSPTTKGKIERVFETVRGQFLVEVEARGGAADLAELNRLFAAWVEVSYHRQAHSQTGAFPIERFMQAGPPSLPTPEMLREAFLWAERRTVSKVAVVSLHGNAYEVDAALVGRRIELVFDPFDLQRIEVRFEGRSMGLAVPHRIRRHTHPKARPEAAPPPQPSGIDYLGLLAARRDAELGGEPISYAGLAPELDNSDDEDRDRQGE